MSRAFCLNCPRRCGADRENGKTGFCGVPSEFRVARVALHPWEEPPISGKNGSGTVFFSGCNLRCVFCQNREISRGGTGKTLTPEELSNEMLRLQEEGAENINLVTPTHYAKQLIPVLSAVRKQLKIPVVWNSGGYEDVETLRELSGLVDIYLPDCKYFSSGLSAKYSGAPDYFAVAVRALEEMLRQVGAPVYSERGTLTRGVIVRHLVLPGARQDSIRLLEELAERFGVSSFLLSLMSQYTPEFAADTPFPELHRRVTTFEYQSVLRAAEQLGFEGFSQGRTSARSSYTPDFSG